jgi:hypothetical protein
MLILLPYCIGGRIFPRLEALAKEKTKFRGENKWSLIKFFRDKIQTILNFFLIF